MNHTILKNTGTELKNTGTDFKWILVYALLICLIMPVTVYSKINETKVKCRVETDRAVLPAGESQNVIVKVTLDAPQAPRDTERPPVNLALVLDRSGSMTGAKIEKAKDAAIEALRRLGPQDIFSVVVYDHHVETIVPAQSAKYAEGIISRIKQIRPGGNTALFGGVSQGAAEIRKHLEEKYIHRIILLSDGLANVGPSTPEDLGRLGAALIKENISVTTIGVGTDYNEDLMARLSQNSDGNTYFVESSYDLPTIFTAELGDVLNVVAKKVKVIIEIPERLRPLAIIGREGRIKDNKIELSLNQLYGGQEKYILVEVQVPKIKEGEKIAIAQANVYYENPFSLENETASGQTIALFSSNRTKVSRSTNVNVVREYQLNLNAIAQEKAIKLSDQGKDEEAARELKQSAAKSKQIGSQYQDQTLLEEAGSLETQAVKIEKEGMSKKDRKILRTDSYKMKNQQKSSKW